MGSPVAGFSRDLNIMNLLHALHALTYIHERDPKTETDRQTEKERGRGRKRERERGGDEVIQVRMYGTD